MNSVEITGKIIERIGFETLNDESAFIKRESIFVRDSGERSSFANPAFEEYRNCKSCRTKLTESNLPKNIIDAIFLIWGDEPTCEDECE